MTDWIDGRNILVTGGTGSIGSVLVQRLLEREPSVVRVLSNDEYGLFNMQQRLPDERLRFLLGDVRDEKRMQHAMRDIDVVYHCAALKHVPLCEYNPFEALQTNVIGTRNCIEAADDQGVERFVMVSTDKAVTPANTMGATKYLAERLVIDAAHYTGHSKLTLSCVRFGNVLYSRGSVLEVFTDQVRRGGPLTVTDPDMTRFFMPVSRAVDLTFEATERSLGGEIFIFKMPSVRLGDLAEALMRVVRAEEGLPEVTVERTGLRPGEKPHEELMTAQESTHALETDEMFIVLPERYDEPRTYAGARPAGGSQYSSLDGPFTTGEDLEGLIRSARGDAAYEL